MKTKRNPAGRRNTLRLVLAGLAVVGIGAAITTAVWTDDVFFGATATASSFDLQNAAAAAGPWSDEGIPGDDAVVTITAADLDALSPGVTIDVPFYLCNVGTTAGQVTAITTPVIGDPLGTAAGAALTATVTTPVVGTALPSDPTCANPVVGSLQVATTADFPFAAQGLSGDITFTVTGTD
jgi:hypothetical protein